MGHLPSIVFNSTSVSYRSTKHQICICFEIAALFFFLFFFQNPGCVRKKNVAPSEIRLFSECQVQGVYIWYMELLIVVYVTTTCTFSRCTLLPAYPSVYFSFSFVRVARKQRLRQHVCIVHIRWQLSHHVYSRMCTLTDTQGFFHSLARKISLQLIVSKETLSFGYF